MPVYNSSYTGAQHDTYVTKQQLVNLIYPVGAIYISVNSTSPATLFGGTWSQIQNRFLLACGSSYSNGATGGEVSHTLTESEMPPHVHIGLFWGYPDDNAWNVTLNGGTAGYQLSWGDMGGSTTNSGGIGSERMLKTGFTGGGGTQQYAALPCCIRLEKNGLIRQVLCNGCI